MANIMQAVEKDVISGRERLIELTPAAVGEGWIHKRGFGITEWVDDGIHTGGLSQRLAGAYARVWEALIYHEKHSCDEPAFVIIAGTVYHTCGECVLDDGTACPLLEPEEEEENERSFWRIGSADEIWERYSNVPHEEDDID